MTYNVLNLYNQYNETIASRGSHGSMNFVAARCVRRCGLRIAFVAHAQEFRCSAVRTPLWATHCLRRIRMPKNFVALQCVRRCGPRIAFVAAECRRISWLCSAYAAVGCILRLSHPNAEEYRLFAAFRCSAVRAPLWTARSLWATSAGANPRVSLWTSWMHNGKPRMSLRTAWLFEAMLCRTANHVVVRSKKLVCGQASIVRVEG